MSDKAEIWTAAEHAVVAGDDATLAQLLREHEKMLRTEGPRSSWLGGLAPDYKDGDARAIVVRNHGWRERRGDGPAAQEPYYETVALLVAASAPVESAWLTEDHAKADPRMSAILRRVKL